ncbi:MAG: hypothetical protein WA603_16080, partial [Candidatus Acidiferrales bacterium]
MSAIDMLDEDPVKHSPIDLSICGKWRSPMVGLNGYPDARADIDRGFVLHSSAQRRQIQEGDAGETVGSPQVSQD